jgi:hypothetical protein
LPKVYNISISENILPANQHQYLFIVIQHNYVRTTSLGISYIQLPCDHDHDRPLDGNIVEFVIYYQKEEILFYTYGKGPVIVFFGR